MALMPKRVKHRKEMRRVRPRKATKGIMQEAVSRAAYNLRDTM